jgi:RNA polymerase sigma factor (sigma-70 family)
MADIDLLTPHLYGSDEAFTALVRRHIDWIYALAIRRLRDPHAADDVTQAVFVLLHRKSPRLPSDRAMIAWLHRTACYATLAAAKSNRRRKNHETRAAMLHPTTSTPDEPAWKDLAPILDDLITKLPRADRQAILLRYYRDMPYTDIAMEIGATPDAVRKRIERAIDKLRALAESRNLMLSSTALATYLVSQVRLAPPPGLIATSATAATAPAVSSIAVPSASIVKGASLMIAVAKLKFVAIASIFAVIVMGKLIIAAQSAPENAPAKAPAPRAAALPNGSAPAPDPSAPFTNIRWRGNTPEVEINNTWYELVSLNDQPIAEIVDFTQRAYRDIWQKRFAEDLVQVMQGLNKPLAAAVKLQLRTLDAKQLITQSVPMTTENRWTTWRNINPDLAADLPPAGALPAGAARQQFPRLSPYPAIRWTGESPQVQIDGIWYELLAIDDIPTEKIIAFGKTTYRGIWQKRFNEDLVEVLTTMDHKPADAVKLSLRTLDTKSPVTLPSVPLTKENRRAIMEQTHPADAPPSL